MRLGFHHAGFGGSTATYRFCERAVSICCATPLRRVDIAEPTNFDACHWEPWSRGKGHLSPICYRVIPKHLIEIAMVKTSQALVAIATTTIGLLVLNSATIALSAEPSPMDICTAARVQFLEDSSVSTAGAESTQIAVIKHVLAAADACPIQPRMTVAAYGGTASASEPVDVVAVDGQLARLAATLSSRWTDPTAALGEAGLTGGDALNLIVTDWRFVERGPVDFGPPQDAQAYLDELRELRATYTFVIIGVGGPAADQDQAFAPLWQFVESQGLGTYLADGAFPFAANSSLRTTSAPTPSAPAISVHPIQHVADDTIAAAQTVALGLSTVQWIGLAVVGGLTSLAMASWVLSRRPASTSEPLRIVQVKTRDGELVGAAPLNGHAKIGDIDLDATGGRTVVRKGGITKAIAPGETVTLSDTSVRLPQPGDSLGAPWEHKEAPIGSLDELTWNRGRPNISRTEDPL